jgi:RsmE family RNA methyltransferase
MNLLLLRHDECTANGTAALRDYRAEHILKVLKPPLGGHLTVGLINGQVGTARYDGESNGAVLITEIVTDCPPPPQLDVELILALPRPRMLQRSLQTIATMGVKVLHLIHTERVERSYWQTPLLKPEAIFEQLVLGLEQAKATQLPQVLFHPRWHPFSTGRLAEFTSEQKVIAHPGPYPKAYPLLERPATIAVGPEGGFTSSEVSKFLDHGFCPVQLGQRILRVETAIPVLLAKMF